MLRLIEVLASISNYFFALRIAQQLLHRRNGLGDSGFHCGSAADRRVNPAEVVVSEVKRERGFQFSHFLLKPMVKLVKHRIAVRMLRF